VITLVQVAGVVIRMFSIIWLIDAMWCTIDLPTDVLGIIHYQTADASTRTTSDAYFSAQREIHLAILLMKVVFYFGLGIVFMFCTRPLAKLLTKGLERVD